MAGYSDGTVSTASQAVGIPQMIYSTSASGLGAGVSEFTPCYDTPQISYHDMADTRNLSFLQGPPKNHHHSQREPNSQTRAMNPEGNPSL